jgi:hypothetical protein
LHTCSEARPGAFINIGIAGGVGSCPVHNPHYDFNDAALPIGASVFTRLVEKKFGAMFRRLTLVAVHVEPHRAFFAQRFNADRTELMREPLYFRLGRDGMRLDSAVLSRSQ